MTTLALPNKDEEGYYEVSYDVNVSTYYMFESIVSPVALNQSRAQKALALKARNDLGKFQQYRLSQFVSSADFQNEKGEIVKLAHVQKGSIVINPKATEIFNKYSNNEVAFVGNYGRLNSGKSFWYDKILNLSEFEGNNYSSNKGGQGLYFWSIPFTKGNLKIFLLDFVGFEGKEKISPDEEKLLDFELLLCEKLVIIPEPNDEELTILKPAYNHLLQSQQRFSEKGIQANKFSPYWPNEIYTLYRSTKPVKKEIDNIGALFSVYNFSILHDALEPSKGKKEDLLKTTLKNSEQNQVLNEKYVKMTSIVFQDIYEKMKGKSQGSITVKGQTLPYIIDQSKSSIKGGDIRIQRIFDGVKDNIYDQTIQNCKIRYLKELEEIKKDKNPKPIDVLTAAFEKGTRAAFAEYDKEIIDPKVHETYEKKLKDQIDRIEKQAIAENKAKTVAHYNKLLPNYEKTEALPKYVSTLNKSFNQQKNKNHLDHNDVEPVSKRLLASVNNEVQQITLAPNSQKIKMDELKRLIKQRRKELDEAEQAKNGGGILKGDSENMKLLINHEDLQKRAEQLKNKVAEHKQSNVIVSPAEKQKLLETLKDTQAKHQETISKIVNNPHKQDEIKEIKRKLEKQQLKNTQIIEGVNKLDNSLNSQRSRSVIRDIQTQNIKKVSQK